MVVFIYKYLINNLHASFNHVLYNRPGANTFINTTAYTILQELILQHTLAIHQSVQDKLFTILSKLGVYAHE